MGVHAVALPLFELEPVEWEPPDCGDFDAILLTSANAVNMAGTKMERLRGLPVHAVGEATALAAEVAGFGVASRGGGGVDDLLRSIEPGARLLHLCGEDRRSPEAAAQAITCITVYRARARPEIAGIDELQGQVAALHSPRAARRLAELVGQTERASIVVAAISKATAQAAGTGWEGVRVAAAATDAALLVLAARLCES
jgi:uroporphyrinogen-III synthase